MMNWTDGFDFLAPARIVFGLNRARSTGDIARELGRKAPLVLADPGIHKLGLTEGVESSLRAARCSGRRSPSATRC